MKTYLERPMNYVMMVGVAIENGKTKKTKRQ